MHLGQVGYAKILVPPTSVDVCGIIVEVTDNTAVLCFNPLAASIPSCTSVELKEKGSLSSATARPFSFVRVRIAGVSPVCSKRWTGLTTAPPATTALQVFYQQTPAVSGESEVEAYTTDEEKPPSKAVFPKQVQRSESQGLLSGLRSLYPEAVTGDESDEDEVGSDEGDELWPAAERGGRGPPPLRSGATTAGGA